MIYGSYSTQYFSLSFLKSLSSTAIIPCTVPYYASTRLHGCAPLQIPVLPLSALRAFWVRKSGIYHELEKQGSYYVRAFRTFVV